MEEVSFILAARRAALPCAIAVPAKPLGRGRAE